MYTPVDLGGGQELAQVVLAAGAGLQVAAHAQGTAGRLVDLQGGAGERM